MNLVIYMSSMYQQGRKAKTSNKILTNQQCDIEMKENP